MTVRTQLFATLGLVTVLLAGPAVYGVTKLAELRDIADALRVGHAEAFHTVGRLQVDLIEIDRAMRSYIISGAPQHVNDMAGGLGRAYGNWNALASYHASAGVGGEWLDELHGASVHIQELVSEGDFAGATAYLDEVRPLRSEGNRALEALALAIDRDGTAEVAQARAISETATRTTLLSVAITLIFALALGIWITSALTSPLRRLRDAMAEVAEGGFDPPSDLPYLRRDEIGDLSRSFSAMAGRLAELDRLKAEFVSVIGHDLRTPVNIISGYAELVEEGSYGEMTGDQREMLGSILDQTRLLTRLANQLLNLSRIEAGGFRIQPEEVEVAHFLSVIRRSFVPLAKRKSIDFTIEVDPATPDAIRADAECIQNEVLGNLLTNAFKFTDARGRVVLSVHDVRGGVRFTVTDTGIGIPEEHLPFVFEKYYRVGKDTGQGGSGLGLAIAREVVEAHGGTIEASSRPGEGTTIAFTLPLRPELDTVRRLAPGGQSPEPAPAG